MVAASRQRDLVRVRARVRASVRVRAKVRASVSVRVRVRVGARARVRGWLRGSETVASSSPTAAWIMYANPPLPAWGSGFGSGSGIAPCTHGLPA